MTALQSIKMISKFGIGTLLALFIHIVAANNYEELVEEKGLQWCGDFCLCQRNSEVRLRCMNPEEMYAMLNISNIQLARLSHIRFNPITQLNWCRSGNCICHRKNGKHFACIAVHSLLTQYIDETALILSYIAEEERHINEVEAADNYSEVGNLNSTATDPEHDKRDMDEERRNRRRNRKNRRNRKRNRNDGRRDENMEEQLYDDSFSREILPAYDDSDANSLDNDPSEYHEISPLPKQEAINSNPMVTAMQPPTVRQPYIPATTQTSPMHYNDSSEPRVQEVSDHNGAPVSQGLNNNSPVYEVPLQRKTVAGKVSEDLKQITEDVQHIRSDVVFNQRILLVTVGVAAVAMLGVVVLALHACCSGRRSRRSTPSENGRNDDNRHPSSTVTKVNLDEAW